MNVMQARRFLETPDELHSEAQLRGINDVAMISYCKRVLTSNEEKLIALEKIKRANCSPFYW